MVIGNSVCAGEPAPWFSAKAGDASRETVAFDELGGRWIVLHFCSEASGLSIAEALAARTDLFDGERALLVVVAGGDGTKPLPRRPGTVFLRDADGGAARRYGLAPGAPPAAFLIDPSLRIADIVTAATPDAHVAQAGSRLAERLAQPRRMASAPVLVVPHVFDHDFCARLVDLYDAAGGREIGQIESDGKIVERFDPGFRKRLDWYISDDAALRRARDMLQRRLLPMVYRAFQFRTTRIERYLVGCYDATTGGYFRAHRDNTAAIVAHRRFAVTINLNDGYEGGVLRFPEFGTDTWSAGPGDAIVFSCSLLHEVLPVTQGRRYAFLSFVYDEESQRLRDAYARKGAEAKA